MRDLFTRYDSLGKGFLSWSEAKEFSSVLLNLDMGRKKDYETFLYLLKEMGCEDQEEFWVESFVEFFLRQDGLIRFEEIKLRE